MTDNPTTRDPTITNLEDTMLVAFLKLKGHVAIPWISRDNLIDPHVSFDIQGDERKIEEDMQRYYENEQVGVQDFCRCLKDVKSVMYNFKKLKR